MLFSSVFKTLRTAMQGYFIKLLVLSLLATALGYGLFLYGIKALLMATSFVPWGWVEWLLDWLAGGTTAVVAYLLFPSIVPLIANLFQEEIAGVIERREYQLEARAKLPMLPEIMNGLSFAAWSLFLNVMILPLFFFLPVYLVAYYTLNSHLLGREFFEIVASRDVGRSEARGRRKDRRIAVLLAGGMIVLLVNVPVLNLFAPFFALALMVHLYRGWYPPETPSARLPSVDS